MPYDSNYVADWPELEGPGDPIEDLFGDEEMAEPDYMTALCPELECRFCESQIFWRGDRADYERGVEKLRQKHRQLHPRCSGELVIG